MQDLFAELLWRNDEIAGAADRLRRSLPGFWEVQRRYEALEGQIRAVVDYDLYDRYLTQSIRYSGYEVYAYYALGLGLREELVQALFTPRSSSPSPAWS